MKFNLFQPKIVVATKEYTVQEYMHTRSFEIAFTSKDTSRDYHVVNDKTHGIYSAIKSYAQKDIDLWLLNGIIPMDATKHHNQTEGVLK